MVFSDTTTKLGLIQDCEMLVFNSYGDISGVANRLYDFTARINRAYDKIAGLIMSADGRWQWDDTNYTEHPIGCTALVSGQQDYTLDVEHLSVSKVIILDSSGNKNLLTPIDENDPVGKLYLTDNTTTGGIPQFYDKRGVSLWLWPIPNYSKASGLQVYYQRGPSYFAYTDTTKAAGIPRIFHRYLSLAASLDYVITKQLNVKNDWAVLIKDMENQIIDFYSKRSKDEAKMLRAPVRSAR